MKIVRLPFLPYNPPLNPSLNDEVNYGRQRGVRYGNLRIMKDRIIANNGTVDSIMLDANGLHGYNNSSQEVLTVNYLGLHGYTTGGVELVRVDALGFHGYDASGNELVKVNNTGTHYYNTSAVELIKVDGSGFHGYDSSSNEIIKVSQTGVQIYNTSGNELVRLSSAGFLIYDTSGVKLISSDNTGFEMWRNSGGSAVSVGKLEDDGFIARNTRGYFMEETSNGNYGSLSMDSNNYVLLRAGPSTDEIWFQDGASPNETYWKFRLDASSRHLADCYSIFVPWSTGSDPSTTNLPNGSIWYNTTSNKLKINENGSIKTFTTS